MAILFWWWLYYSGGGDIILVVAILFWWWLFYSGGGLLYLNGGGINIYIKIWTSLGLLYCTVLEYPPIMLASFLQRAWGYWAANTFHSQSKHCNLERRS